MWFVKRNSFTRGVLPEEHKEGTAGMPIRRLAFPPEMILPLAQHLGVPSVPVVHEGQEVVRGEPVARARGFLSVPLHAPATSVVSRIGLAANAEGVMVPSISLKLIPSATQEVLYGAPVKVSLMEPSDIVQAVQNTGIVGLGGTAFPTHVKMVLPQQKSVDTIIANGCECEPWLTSDHRLMVERAGQVYEGIRVALFAMSARTAIVAVHANKPEAIEAMRKAMPTDIPVTLQLLEPRYPQGAEKILVKTLLGRVVPSGGFPTDVGCAVFNVATLAQIGECLPNQQGLIERVITVTGTGVERPGNYLLPVGTPLRHILEHAGLKGGARRVILGGPMMGMSVSSLDAPVTKGMTGLLVMQEEVSAEPARRTFPCIKCGQCIAVCPVQINPAQLCALARRREYDKMEEDHHLQECFECGCCSYVCPSNIPLVQHFRVAKAVLRQRQAGTNGKC